MTALVLEHQKAKALPKAWARKLRASAHDRFTVTIQPETQPDTRRKADPLFGIWRDRDDLDVSHHVDQLRKSRL